VRVAAESHGGAESCGERLGREGTTGSRGRDKGRGRRSRARRARSAGSAARSSAARALQGSAVDDDGWQGVGV